MQLVLIVPDLDKKTLVHAHMHKKINKNINASVFQIFFFKGNNDKNLEPMGRKAVLKWYVKGSESGSSSFV